MNLLEQLRYGSPPKLTRYFCSNLKVNAGNEQVSPPIHETSDIPQTIFCSRRLHMAKKVVRYDDVLWSKDIGELWRRGVAKLPSYSLPKPGLNSGVVTFKIKYLLHFLRS